MRYSDVLPFIYRTGTSNIAESIAKTDVRPFVLASLEIHFSGGTGTANLVISRDSFQGSLYDADLYTITGCGTGTDVNFFVRDDEVGRRFLFDAREGESDQVKLAWTNPDDGNMRWAMRLGLAYAE